MSSVRATLTVLLVSTAVLAVLGAYNPKVDWIKILQQPKTYYNPRRVDWNALKQGCKYIWKGEPRLRAFVIRAIFHDSMAVDVEACKKAPYTVACSGADASNIYNTTEQDRFENQGFTEFIAYKIRKLAAFYGASAADTLAVCGAVAIEDASDYRVKIFRQGMKGFLTGRVDNYDASPEGKLLSPLFTNTTDFYKFWYERGIDADEGVALLGSHCLLRPLGCAKSSKPGDDCDSLGKRKSVKFEDLAQLALNPPDDCSAQATGPNRLLMFRWENHYYKQACSPDITEIGNPFLPELQLPELNASIDTDVLTKHVRSSLCGFKSKEFRRKFLQYASQGKQLQPVLPKGEGVKWKPDCKDPYSNACHRDEWPFTSNDGTLGLACQDKIVNPSDGDRMIGAAMKKFSTNQAYWDEVLPRAYLKMVNNFVVLKYPGRPAWLPPYYIDGDECPSGYLVDDDCAKENKYVKPYKSRTRCAYCGVDGTKCDKCCRCYTAIRPKYGYASRLPTADLGAYAVSTSD